MNWPKAGWVIVAASVVAWCVLLWVFSGCTVRVGVDYEAKPARLPSSASAASGGE